MSVYFVILKFHLRNTFFLSKQAVANSVSVFIIKNTYLLMLFMNACHLCGQSSVKELGFLTQEITQLRRI